MKRLAAVLVLLIGVLHLGSCARLSTAKEAHAGKAKVIRKDFVQFSSDQTSYVNAYGESIPIEQWRRRDGEKRLYLAITQYDEPSEEARSACARLEAQRAKQHGELYEIVDGKLFEDVHTGETLNVRYIWDGQAAPRVISVSEP